MTETAIDTGLEATLAQIDKMAARRQVLQDAQLAAEDQVLHRIGVMWRAGQLTPTDLVALCGRVRASGLPGWSKRWNAAVGVTSVSLAGTMRNAPNGADGSWWGVSPLPPSDPSPPLGVPVVYVLIDAAGQACYVGSTMMFRERVKAHRKAGKVFTRWQAYPCRSREEAYEREDAMLRQVKPYLNRKAGR